MNTEEKAKAYDEALEKAKRLYEQDTITESLAYIFPELKNKDEEIRKWLICGMNALKEQKNETFATIPIDDAIAWLEKQGYTKKDIDDAYLKGICDAKHELEKQGTPVKLDEKEIQTAKDKMFPYQENVGRSYEQALGASGFELGAHFVLNRLRSNGYSDEIYKQGEFGTFDVPQTPIKDAVEVTSRMPFISDDMKPIAEFIMGYANWDLHKDEWNQPTLTVPLFRVLDALIQRGKPYGECNQNIEKQGEQKPADKVEPIFSIGDVLCDKSCTTLNKKYQPIIEILDIRDGMYICNNCSFPISQQYEYELVTKKNEPQYAWSDEDEHRVEDTIYFLDTAKKHYACTIELDACIDWLKSLKDRIGG